MLNKYEYTSFQTHLDGRRFDRHFVCTKFADLSTHGWEYVDLLEDEDGSYYLFKRTKPSTQNAQNIDL